MILKNQNNKHVTDRMEAGKVLAEILCGCPDRYCLWLENLNRNDLRYFDH